MVITKQFLLAVLLDSGHLLYLLKLTFGFSQLTLLALLHDFANVSIWMMQSLVSITHMGILGYCYSSDF